MALGNMAVLSCQACHCRTLCIQRFTLQTLPTGRMQCCIHVAVPLAEAEPLVPARSWLACETSCIRSATA